MDPYYRRRLQQRPKPPELPRSAALDMLAADKYADRPWGVAGEMLLPRNEPPAPQPQPFVIPPPPWSPNYVPELDPDYEPAPEPEAVADEPEALPRPAVPPPPWVRPSVADEETPSAYPPPERGEV